MFDLETSIADWRRQMVAGGMDSHSNSAEERTFVFRPLYRPGDITASATCDLLTRVFQGSVYGLVAHLFEHEAISPEERRRLRESEWQR